MKHSKDYMGPKRRRPRSETDISLLAQLVIMLLIVLPSLLLLVECGQTIDTGPITQSPTVEAHRKEHLGGDKLALAANASSHNRATSVAGLRLTADYRAAKLRWIYRLDQGAHDRTTSERQQPEPASFDVRFCELTTWRVEIKCRHREMLANDNKTDNSVIIATKPTTVGQQLTVLRRDDDSIEYEAQIFDLRALTNYTISVKVLRFNDEPASGSDNGTLRPDSNQLEHRASNGAGQVDRSSLARRLSVEHQPMTNELVGRIETKPFRAEATKCLADVSEVVITTGKYFGGRITVEDSLDRRCQLFGNKSSEQTSYTFRIDHEICRSKVVDGNRIETMILVHENKDILTHNTARFLVLCNFLQKSFTLRASISLPKVNGFMSNRPAVITPLTGQPSKDKPVQLGSMPGIFRPKVTDNSSPMYNESREAANQHLNELNISSLMEEKMKTAESGDSRQRQPKVLEQRRSSSMGPRSRSLELHRAEPSSIPQPVQIQSKTLYVERQPILANLVMARMASPAAEDIGKPIESSHEAHPQGLAQTKPHDEPKPRKSPPADSAELEDAEGASIILTNNHRVVGDYKPTAALKIAPPSPVSGGYSLDSDGGLSIKYSGAKVSEYSVDRLEERTGFAKQQADSTQKLTPHLQTMTRRGERTGRMHNIDNAGQKVADQGWSTATNRRMGDMLMDSGDLLADTSNNSLSQSSLSGANTSALNQPQLANSNSPNLAQNLTNYLLKWSLRTLTNLAKKSLESLANRSDSNQGEHFATEPGAATNFAVNDEDLDASSGPASVGERQLQAVVAHRTSERPLASPPKPDISASDGFDTHSRPQRVRPPSSTTPRPAKSSTLTLPAAPVSSVGATNGAQPADRHATGSHHSRASNYSKSLDLDRSDNAKARQLLQPSAGRAVVQPNSLPAAPVVPERMRDHVLARSNESGQHMRHDRESPGSMSWLLVGSLLVLALLISALTIFCLASSYPSRLQNIRPSHDVHHPAPAPKTAARLNFNGTIVTNGDRNQGNETLNSHLDILSPARCTDRYDYNRFENHLRDVSAMLSAREGATLGGHNGRAGASSISATSSAGSSDDGDSNSGLVLGNKQTTQSTQLRLPTVAKIGHSRNAPQVAGRAIIGGHDDDDDDDDDENNCTNSELLLDEHVLVGAANSRATNESYA